MEFITRQWDYLMFTGGFLFLVLAAFALFAHLFRQLRPTWLWLAAGTFCLGLAEWAVLPAELGWSAARNLRLLLALSGGLCVLQFGLSALVWPPRWRMLRPFSPILALAPLAAAVFRPDTAMLVLAHAVVLPGLLVTAGALARMRRQPLGFESGRRALAMVGRGCTGLGLVWTAREWADWADGPGLFGPNGPTLIIHLCFIFLLTATVLFLAGALWYYLRTQEPAVPRSKGARLLQSSRLFFASLGLILMAGWILTEQLGHIQEKRMQTFFLQQVLTTAAMLPTEHVATLTGRPEDLATPNYPLIKDRFMAARKGNQSLGFLYLIGIRNGHVFFLVDSEPPGSTDYSPPGQLYEEAPAELLASAKGHAEQASRPYRDRWGFFVSAYAPIPVPDGHFPVVLGMDVNADQWLRDVAMQRLVGILCTLAIALVVLTVFLVIQNLREVNAHIAESEEKFHTIVESIHDAITIHDLATGDVIDANRMAYEMAGLPHTPGNPPPLTPFSVHETPWDAAAADRWIRAAAAGEPQFFTWKSRDTHGRTFWVDVGLRKVAIHGRDCLLTVVRNIDARVTMEEELKAGRMDLEKKVRERTADLARSNSALKNDIDARTKAENRLRESEGRFRTLAETSLVGIIILQDDRFLYANPGVERITGMSHDDIMSARFSELLHPDDREKVRQNSEDRQAGRAAPDQLEMRLLTRAGQEKRLLVNAGLITSGGRSASMATLVDITAQRKLEEERQAISERSQETRKLESLGALAGGIAHDFNNLLMSVLGNADLLLADPPPTCRPCATPPKPSATPPAPPPASPTKCSPTPAAA